MKEELIKETIKYLPTAPGIYKYFDKEGTIIYVGKAKNIKKRVSSYFNKIHQDNKTNALVHAIEKIEFLVVDTEIDALLLENNLIKENQPKYNIALKDDKSYPYIYVTRERYPKVFTTPKYNPNNGEAFGPFTNKGAMYVILDLIKKLFTFRTCDLKLTEKNVTQQKFKRCLEFHIGHCKAPCEGLHDEEAYNRDIEQVKILLSGDLTLIKNHFNQELKKCVEKLAFEQAHKIKTKLDLLEKYQSSSLVDGLDYDDLAIFTIKTVEKRSYINVLKISFGRIVKAKTIEAIHQIEEEEEEVFALAIVRLMSDLAIETKDIITNIPVNIEQKGVKISVPKIGEKKHLIDLSLKNLDYFIVNTVKTDEKETPNLRILETLQKDLSLKELPDHIECFDNSNFQGTTPVAAMVCFKNGLPYKKEYRHFHIKTVVGPNDFESMEEIVYRRYSRLQKENLPFPKLIIIDGGKGQLSSAIKSLKKLDLYGQIPIVSIAKRLEEIYLPGDDLPVMLKKTSESLRLIQRIRDEVHRFGITFHRKKRDAMPKIPKNKIKKMGS
jgi:excinuclease ABC subunit C